LQLGRRGRAWVLRRALRRSVHERLSVVRVVGLVLRKMIGHHLGSHDFALSGRVFWVRAPLKQCRPVKLDRLRATGEPASLHGSELVGPAAPVPLELVEHFKIQALATGEAQSLKVSARPLRLESVNSNLTGSRKGLEHACHA